MLNFLAAGALATSLVFSPTTGASLSILDEPPAGDITVEVVTVNGSGCPADTAAVAVSPDNTAFTVTYSEYTAMVGVGAVPTDARKNCQVNLLVHVPQGFTYAIDKTDYRGYGYLEKGASALEKANYYFQGMSRTSSISHYFVGPMDDDWQTTDEVNIAALVFAPCGEQRFLNINTELRVNAGSSNVANTTSLMSMDSMDGEFSTTYRFSWAKCPVNG